MKKRDEDNKTASPTKPTRLLYATVGEGIVPACMLERDYVRLGILYYISLRQRANWSYYNPYDVAKWTGLNFQAVQRKMRELENEDLLIAIPPEDYTKKLRLDIKYYNVNHVEFERRYLSREACMAIRARCEAKLQHDKHTYNNRPGKSTPATSDLKSVSHPAQTDQKSVASSDQKSVAPQTTNLTKNEDVQNEELILEGKCYKEQALAPAIAPSINLSPDAVKTGNEDTILTKAKRTRRVKYAFAKQVHDLSVTKRDFRFVHMLLENAFSGQRVYKYTELYDKYRGLEELIDVYITRYQQSKHAPIPQETIELLDTIQ